MLWILYLISVFIIGNILDTLLLNKTKGLLKLISSFIIGSIISVDFIYFLTTYILKNLNYSIILYFLVFLILFIFARKKNIAKSLFLSKYKILFLILLFIPSWYLFNKTFSYDSSGSFLVSTNTYLDFGAHIPFIRSFSLGYNFPMEVPFFANKHLSYHMMFDFYVGIIEHLGLRIDYALNLISVFSFIFLLIMIYKLANLIFSQKTIGYLSVILFLFNSDLSFVNFFKENKFSFSIISSFWHNAFFNVNGPLGPKTVSVFWNLNTFFNQRHLIFGLLISLFIILYLFLILKNKNYLKIKGLIFLGIIVGLMPFWHTSIFMALFIVFFGFFIFDFKMRKKIIILGITALAISIFEIVSITSTSTNKIIFNPGFLISVNLSFQNLFIFWFWNLGFGLITILLGFIISNREQKKLFLILLLLFIFPNLFQFSKDIYDNHKLFNLWIIFANFYSAYFLVYLFKKNNITKIFAVVSCVAITLSGILNIMVTKNDIYVKIPDYTGNKLMKWALSNISNDSILLTNGEIYDPMSLIGKKIFLTRHHYIFLYGGNPDDRLTKRSLILAGLDDKKIKKQLN